MKPSFIIYGARGTLPVGGKDFEKYGGHTTCFCLKTSQGLIIIDAGTGISLIDETKDEELLPATMLFTHFHLDHLLSLPFLKRIYNQKSSLKLMADPSRRPDLRSTLMNLFTPPYWPVLMDKTAASFEFNNLPEGAFSSGESACGGNSIELYGVRVSWCHLYHPQGSLAYRLETAEGSVAVVTDHECGDPKLDDILLQFCSKADFLIYDAQYTPDEMETHRGWGHSSWAEGVEIAVKAKVGELILTHHDYKRQDDEIDAIVEATRRHFPKTRAANEGMILF